MKEDRLKQVYIGSAKVEKFEGKVKQDIYNKDSKLIKEKTYHQGLVGKKKSIGGGCSSCRGNKKI